MGRARIVTLLIISILSWQREAAVIRTYLADDVASGTVTGDEYAVLPSLGARFRQEMGALRQKVMIDDAEGCVRALNRIGYEGPLSIEWEDSGMDREYGAQDALAFARRTDFAPSTQAFDAAFAREE